MEESTYAWFGGPSGRDEARLGGRTNVTEEQESMEPLVYELTGNSFTLAFQC